jgi:hypothetical protein
MAAVRGTPSGVPSGNGRSFNPRTAATCHFRHFVGRSHLEQYVLENQAAKSVIVTTARACVKVDGLNAYERTLQ